MGEVLWRWLSVDDRYGSRHWHLLHKFVCSFVLSHCLLGVKEISLYVGEMHSVRALSLSLRSVRALDASRRLTNLNSQAHARRTRAQQRCTISAETLCASCRDASEKIYTRRARRARPPYALPSLQSDHRSWNEYANASADTFVLSGVQ